ncbi:Type III secretion integral inner membrane protein [Chlamydiales bacterium STE3]|nr:Type III secretion integral inner membrane protein [Chlamydiales bacterium STE3]
MEVDSAYATLFLNSAFAKGDFLGALTLVILFLGRMLPIIALSPFFGARILPHPVKVVFALTLFVIFLPKLLEVTTTPITFNLMSLFLLAKEFFVGFCMGYVISIPFIIVQTTGIIIDHQRGGASLMVNDPTIQNQSSPLGTLFNFVLIYLFFLIDGPFLVIDLLGISYDIIPPDRFINPDFFRKNSAFWSMQMDVLNRVMVIGIQLATPALLIMLMTDLFLGIANRLAPQVQITFLGMALKSLLGLGIVCLGWYLFLEEANRDSYRWIYAIRDMLNMFKPSVPPLNS